MAKKEGLFKRIFKNAMKIPQFLLKDLWSVRLEEYPPKMKFLFKYLRIIVLSLRGSYENKVTVRASALTYYTLMSIVPVLAMGFGIAKGFGADKYLEKQIMESVKGQEEVMNKLITFSNSLLERTGGGLIAGIGIVLLFYSVAKVLSSIETSFNDIWKIEKHRTLSRKFSDYLSMMLIAPILLIAAGSIHVYLATQLNTIAKQIEIIGYISPYIMFFLKFIPYLLIWILFSLMYIVMPNTKVSYQSGIIAGIIAGSAFVVTQWFYIDFQVGVSRYNAIYGSFAALPLFLIWIQVSWLIVLFGAEVSFANQNVDMYEFESETERISPYSKRNLSLLILNLIVKRFVNGEEALTALELSQNLKVPVRLMKTLLNNLIQCKILVETISSKTKNTTYQPAQHIDNFTVAYVINALDNLGAKLEPDIPEMQSILRIHTAITANIEGIKENVLMKEI
ncbi:MAG: YihY/virulence factor BrkB family protein [Bacteroidales bacterium]|nr:YihY/virulence factor BrkB family protein [Bacteroidales bacterium]